MVDGGSLPRPLESEGEGNKDDQVTDRLSGPGGEVKGQFVGKYTTPLGLKVGIQRQIFLQTPSFNMKTFRFMSYILHVFNNVNLKSHILSVWTYKYKKTRNLHVNFYMK